MIDLVIGDGVATIHLDNAPVNALDLRLLDRFHEVLDVIDTSDDLRVVVINSRLRLFSAGADLALVKSFLSDPRESDGMLDYVKELHRLFDRIEALPQVTLSVLRGSAIGGGLELALACDLRIAALEASLGLPEARLGMIPGAGGTQRLTRLCGIGTAARIILTAEMITGEEALRVGLAQWAVPAEELDDRVAHLARSIAVLAAPALTAAKDCIYAAGDPKVDGYARELEKPKKLLASQEARERITAFFENRSKATSR